MTTLLFFDTETNGLPIWDRHSDHPDQPRIVELAAVLAEFDGEKLIEYCSMSTVIKPDGWGIPDNLVEIHGITNDIAAKYGMPIKTALDAFMGMWDRCNMRVAHSEPFDCRMIRGETIRLYGREVGDLWKAGESFDTMQKCRPIVKALNAKGKVKPPKLTECFEFFTGHPMTAAHGALSDVQACMTVYEHLTIALDDAAANKNDDLIA